MGDTSQCNVKEAHHSAGVWTSMVEKCLGHGFQEGPNVGLWVTNLHSFSSSLYMYKVTGQ